MSLESDVYGALQALVSNRVYPLTFSQPNGGLPAWPAIRYTFVDAEPGASVCGDGEAAADTVRLQLDLVATTYTAVRALRLQVISAMAALGTPNTRDGEGEEYDSPTKTYRVQIDYLVQPSSL